MTMIGTPTYKYPIRKKKSSEVKAFLYFEEIKLKVIFQDFFSVILNNKPIIYENITKIE